MCMFIFISCIFILNSSFFDPKNHITLRPKNWLKLIGFHFHPQGLAPSRASQSPVMSPRRVLAWGSGGVRGSRKAITKGFPLKVYNKTWKLVSGLEKFWSPERFVNMFFWKITWKPSRLIGFGAIMFLFQGGIFELSSWFLRVFLLKMCFFFQGRFLISFR